MSDERGSMPELAAAATEEEYAAMFPGLELLPLGVDGAHGRLLSDVIVDREGRPQAAADEKILSRWIGATGPIAMDIDGAAGRGERSNVPAVLYKGGLRLVLTDRRLVGAFNSAVTERWGRVSMKQEGEQVPAVLGLSWPYGEITQVAWSWKKRFLGGKEFTGCQVRGARPLSALLFEVAVAANDAWEGPERGSESDQDLGSIAQAMVHAVADYRIANGHGDPNRLRTIRDGQFEVSGTTATAIFE